VARVRRGFCSWVVAFFYAGRRLTARSDLGGTLQLEKERREVIH
jgi:hypothetical protein